MKKSILSFRKILKKRMMRSALPDRIIFSINILRKAFKRIIFSANLRSKDKELSYFYPRFLFVRVVLSYFPAILLAFLLRQTFASYFLFPLFLPLATADLQSFFLNAKLDVGEEESIVCEDFKDGKGIKALGYVRVSTERQAEHGFSIEAQINELRELAKKKGASRFYHIVDAGKSGVDFDKRSLNKILELAERKEIDEVLVVDIDRIGRNCRKLMEFFLDLRDYGVVVATPAGEMDVDELTGLMMLALKSWAAQYENERRARAAMAGRIQAFLKRRWNKPIPIGYRKRENGWIEKNPDRTPVIEDIFSLFITVKNCQAVADSINRRYASFLSKPLTLQQVSRILNDSVYAGRPGYCGKAAKNQFAGGISDISVDDQSLAYVNLETFGRAQKSLNEIRERHRRRKKRRYMELIEKYDYEVLRFMPHLAIICPNSSCGTPMNYNGLTPGGLANNFICPKCGRQLRVPKKSELRKIEEWASKQKKFSKSENTHSSNRKNESLRRKFDDVRKNKTLDPFF